LTGRRAAPYGEAVRSLRIAIVVALVASVGARAFAESAEAEVERLAAEAVSAYKGADYKRAVELLQQAYDIRQVPALLYNMAKAYDKLGDVEHAYDAYRRYADSAAADPKLKERAEARLKSLAEARRQKAATARAIESPPPPPSPTTVEPQPTPAVAPSTPPPPTPEERARAHDDFVYKRHRARLITLGLGAATVAFAIVAGSLSIDALVVEHQFSSATLPDAQSRLKSDAVVRGGVADGFWGATAVTAAVTAYFVYLSFRHEPSSSSMALVPLLSPTGGGLAATGRF
jgi:tetratricopeptide (TPR) repeat protein